KVRRFEGMGPREIVDWNEGLTQPLRRLTTTSVADYLACFKQFWRAVRADHEGVRDITSTPLSVPRTASRPIAREGLQIGEVNTWLAHAARQPRADDRWLPLLGLLTGARLGELVFLQGRDIQQVGKHWTASLRDDLEGPEGVA